MISPHEIKNRFKYHPPTTDERKEAHEIIRKILFDAAMHVVELTPDGREQSLAITKLEEAMFWANAAIARE